jgi:ubiquinone/menaquinone biosynthesis C-methylase UbiE
MAKASYDDIAAWYDVLVRAGSLADQIVVPPLFELIGNVQGQRVCDLACGTGRITRALAGQGAQVTGVDLSAELLTIAQRDEAAEASGITYLLDNAETLASLPDETFDGVVCHLALMDIANLAGTCQAVWRVLRSPGWFVFSITHPCFEAPHSTWTRAIDGTISREVRHYFTEGFWRSENVEGVRGQVGAYHRILSTYLNTLIQAGFTIECIIEPRATGLAADRIPGYAVVPAFMLARSKKD